MHTLLLTTLARNVLFVRMRTFGRHRLNIIQIRSHIGLCWRCVQPCRGPVAVGNLVVASAKARPRVRASTQPAAHHAHAQRAAVALRVTMPWSCGRGEIGGGEAQHRRDDARLRGH